MQVTTTSNVNQTPESSDGFKVGDSASSKIGFYGATPVAQRASANQAAVTTTAATSTTPFGYTQAQADAIVTLLNEIRATLVEIGLMKGSA